MPVNVYHRKLYALLHNAQMPDNVDIAQQLQCLQEHLDELKSWWQEELGQRSQEIGSSSDRVNLESNAASGGASVQVSHPISGQLQTVAALEVLTADDIANIQQLADSADDVKRIFWWFWRFYPELLAEKQQDALLFPADNILPDCPLHSYCLLYTSDAADE